MNSVHDYKAKIKIGVNINATVTYMRRPNEPVMRIGTVVKVQGKEYAVKYGNQPNERTWLRFPLVRELEVINGNKIQYSTFDKKTGEKVSTTIVEVGK